MIWRLAKDLNFDPMGISRAKKLKMEHKKNTYFHHYVPWTKISDDMNKSFIYQICDLYALAIYVQDFFF